MMQEDQAGPNVPMIHSVVIPPRIWKRFLMGTYSWMIASIVYMLLAILSAAYYGNQQMDTASQITVSVSYVLAIMSIYWLSAGVRDLYRYQVLRSDPQLNQRIKQNLGGPSDCTRGIRIVFAVAGVLAAAAVFIVAMTQTKADKITGCVIELQMVVATAVLTKTFQDREDAAFLAKLDSPV